MKDKPSTSQLRLTSRSSYTDQLHVLKIDILANQIPDFQGRLVKLVKLTSHPIAPIDEWKHKILAKETVGISSKLVKQ